MDIIDALDEIKQKNSLMEKVDSQAILGARIQERAQVVIEKEVDEDEWVKGLFYSADDGRAVRRVVDSDTVGASSSVAAVLGGGLDDKKKNKRLAAIGDDDGMMLALGVVSKKAKGAADVKGKAVAVQVVAAKKSVALCDYASDSDSSE